MALRRTTDVGGTGRRRLYADNKLLWVNSGTDGPPTSGQAGAYMLFNYDLNGNMTHRERRFPDGTFQSFDLAWDGADNLAQINVHGGGEIFSAGYNGDGLRVSMQDTASGSFPTQHNFSWGLGGLLYDLYQSAVYTPGVSQNVSGSDSYFDSDWLGSTRYLSDSTGNNFTGGLRYDAFGNRTDTSTPYDLSPFRFAGDWGYQSEFATGPEAGTGLLYLQERYYDPAIGRFISRDPVGFAGGLNPYGYSDNDPVNEADPGGRNPLLPVLVEGAHAVGAAAGAAEAGTAAAAVVAGHAAAVVARDFVIGFVQSAHDVANAPAAIVRRFGFSAPTPYPCALPVPGGTSGNLASLLSLYAQTAASQVTSATGLTSGARYGTLVHTQFENLLDALGEYT